MNRRIYGLDLLWLLLFLCLNEVSLLGQNLQPGHSLTSRSKQFVITSSVNAPLPALATKSKPIPDRVRLSPAPLATLAGSIRQQWVRKFRISSQWKGRLYLHIVPGKIGDPPDIRKIAAPTGGWDYRAILPQEIAGRTLTQVIIELLLREFGARYTSKGSIPPPWLIAGTAELILQTQGPVLFVPFHTNGGGGINYSHPQDSLHASRKIIQDSTNFSFIKMSLPPPEFTQGEKLAIYRAYSHLLVYKLLSKNEGAKRMQYFLRELTKHKNSANAFRIAFGHETMLRTEQWWTVSQIQFRSRDAYNRWRPNIILAHLSDSLLVSVKNDPPAVTDPQPSKLISIQDFLKTGTHLEHAQKLNPILLHLKFLEVNATPESARLIRDYRSILESHLGARPTDISRVIRNKPSAIKALQDRTINQLNLLDTILKDMTKKPDEGEFRTKQIGPSPR